MLRTTVAQKRNNDTVLVEAPRDTNKRMRFFIGETNKIVNGEPSNIVVSNNALKVPDKMKAFIDNSHDISFEPLQDTVAPTVKHSKQAINSDITAVANKIVGSVVKFELGFLYISSGDVFLHNHALYDDCAYGMNNENEYEDIPVAKVQCKTYMMKNEFHEVSVFWGMYEVLVCGGVFFNKVHQSLHPFLGSSLPQWKFGEMSSNKIFFHEATHLIRTARLLNNYARRDSHRPWGFHVCHKYMTGFSPIIPIDYLNHKSQQNRQANVHHFASQLLRWSTVRELCTKDEMDELFLFLLTTNGFHFHGQRPTV